MTGVILAAGFGSRLRRPSAAGPLGMGSLKPTTKVAGMALLERAVRSLEVAGCVRIVIVVGYGRDAVMASLRGYQGRADIGFVDNPLYDLKNGVSLLAAREHIRSDRFVLTMADHVVGDEVMRLAGAHVSSRVALGAAAKGDTATLGAATKGDMATLGAATLLVDKKLYSIFDMDDATKVWADGARLVKIGKTITPFNCVDTGVFVGTDALMDAIAEVYRRTGDASLSEGVQALADRGAMSVLDIGHGFWQDVDTPAMLAFAERELARRG